MFSDLGGDPTEPQDPNEGENPAVAPIEGDQGQPVPVPSEPGFNPDAPAPISAPPADAQPGVPDLPGGDNEGVEGQPDYAGPVEPGTPAPDEDETPAPEEPQE